MGAAIEPVSLTPSAIIFFLKIVSSLKIAGRLKETKSIPAETKEAGSAVAVAAKTRSEGWFCPVLGAKTVNLRAIAEIAISAEQTSSNFLDGLIGQCSVAFVIINVNTAVLIP